MSVKKTISFHLMTTGPKTVDFMSNLSETLPGHVESLQYSFEFFLAVILLELIVIICKKKCVLKILLTSGDLNIGLT